MGTLRFFEEVVSFKIRRTFGFADYRLMLPGLLEAGVFIADSVPCRSGSRRFQVRCGMTTAVERQLAAVIVAVRMSGFPAVLSDFIL